MKTIFLSVFTFLFFYVAQAQTSSQKKAAQLLEAVSAKYKSFTSYKVNFTYTIENTQSKVKEDLSGEITIKGEKFKLILPTQEIINNGATVWTYLKEENEVTISKNEPNADVITPSNIYNQYKKGYTYQFLEEKKEGNMQLEIVELVPEKKNSATTKIKIFINKADHTIKKWTLFERSGTQYHYSITKFIPNPSVIDSFFNFDQSAHKGLEVVDLRD